MGILYAKSDQLIISFIHELEIETVAYFLHAFIHSSLHSVTQKQCDSKIWHFYEIEALKNVEVPKNLKTARYTYLQLFWFLYINLVRGIRDKIQIRLPFHPT